VADTFDKTSNVTRGYSQLNHRQQKLTHKVARSLVTVVGGCWDSCGDSSTHMRVNEFWPLFPARIEGALRWRCCAMYKIQSNNINSSFGR
jgi:hypothetical protein